MITRLLPCSCTGVAAFSLLKPAGFRQGVSGITMKRKGKPNSDIAQRGSFNQMQQQASQGASETVRTPDMPRMGGGCDLAFRISTDISYLVFPPPRRSLARRDLQRHANATSFALACVFLCARILECAGILSHVWREVVQMKGLARACLVSWCGVLCMVATACCLQAACLGLTPSEGGKSGFSHPPAGLAKNIVGFGRCSCCGWC